SARPLIRMVAERNPMPASAQTTAINTIRLQPAPSGALGRPDLLAHGSDGLHRRLAVQSGNFGCRGCEAVKIEPGIAAISSNGEREIAGCGHGS
ncbi:MAG TPA: hypothetical protein VFE89_06050, partial [Beijerinckiaceae bacterium]|nr:hypothetical protein [Beijerinckiaceae bacterium]